MASAPPRPLSESLIGTWELLARVDETAGGERRVDPGLGADPVALLYYDRAGHFAAQFMKRSRDGSPAPAAAAGPNNSRAQDGYDAYFGTYTVDDAAGAVTQRLLGASSRENVGLVLTRRMQVEGDALTIRVDTAGPDGTPLVRTLTWRRVG